MKPEPAVAEALSRAATQLSDSERAVFLNGAFEHGAQGTDAPWRSPS